MKLYSRIRLWGKNFAKQQKEWMTLSPLSNYEYSNDFDQSQQQNILYICNYFVTFPFCSRLSLNLVERCKIGCCFLFLALKLVSLTISGNIIQKLLFWVIFRPFFGQDTCSVTMATG